MRSLLAESQKSLSHHSQPNSPPRTLLPGVHGPLPAMAKIKTARPTHTHTWMGGTIHEQSKRNKPLYFSSCLQVPALLEVLRLPLWEIVNTINIR